MKQNNIGNLLKTECYGCSACEHTCPFSAIEMRQDQEGFLYPVVDGEKCTQCGKCRKICPAIHEKDCCNQEVPESYVLRADDRLRSVSTSGGATTLLANAIFAEGGAVCGVIMDDDFRVYHIVTEDKEDLKRIRLSKYVQSDLGNVFPQIRSELKKGKKVMFTGTPCQVAGLKAYLQGNPENLLAVDLVCHGPTSQMVFDRYLEETFGKEHVKEFKFRTKNYGYTGTTCEVTLDDGKTYMGAAELDPLEKALYRSLCLRQTCQDCKFASCPRVGDITIGDAWGIAQYKQELSDGRGTSLILVNNEKGKAWFEKIRGNAQLVEEVPLEALTRKNRFRPHTEFHSQRGRFFEMLSYTTLRKAVTYCMENRYDVGILGVWFGCNYGSIATYYGLKTILENMGLSVLMVEKPGFPLTDRELAGGNHSRIFARTHFHVSRPYKLPDMKALNNICDSFVVGSDQVWNYGIGRNFGRSFLLDFARDEKKKVAIAASFGHAKDFRPDRERVITSELLKRFDAISVREESAVGILKKIFGVESTQILDPVFIADRRIYDDLAEESSRDEKEPYIIAYILDPTPEKRAAVQYLERKLGIKAYYILDGQPWVYHEKRSKMEPGDRILEGVNAQDWIYYFKNSRYVITDSCHGMSFAILYHKPFAGIGNTARGITRFNSLVKLFHLESRFVTNPSDIMNDPRFLEPMDYREVDEILKKEKKRSLDWIHDAMFRPKTVQTCQAYSLKVKSMYSKEPQKVQPQKTPVQKQKTVPRKVYRRLPSSIQSRVRKIIGKYFEDTSEY